MAVSDEEFMLSLKTVSKVLTSIFIADTAVVITDCEKVVLFKQADTFKMNIIEGGKLGKSSGPALKAMQTGVKQIAHHPREIFGVPVTTCSLPVINEYTGNTLGTITYCVSQEKEQAVLAMASELQSICRGISGYHGRTGQCGTGFVQRQS